MGAPERDRRPIRGHRRRQRMDRTAASDRRATDTRHPFVLDAAGEAAHLRLDVYPDGGLSRLRLFGDLDEQALSDARRTWWDALPPSHQALVADQAPR